MLGDVAVDAELIQELISHYGLNGNPFGPRADAFYDGAQRKHNLEVLRHMAIFGDMILVLTGERGAGKTALLQQFSKEFAQDINVSLLTAGTGADNTNSIERLATISGLELPGQYPARDKLEHLIDQFSELFQRSSKRSLIIIDDAHLLSDEELTIYLAVMSSLEPESGCTLLLSGLPSLTAVCTHYKHPDRDEWYHQVQLKPLSQDDTLEYLMCRLKAVGYQGDEVLSASQLKQLSQSAQGLPVAINRLFPLVALNQGVEAESRAKPVDRAAKLALSSISLVLLLAFGFLAYQNGMIPTADTDKLADSLSVESSLLAGNDSGDELDDEESASAPTSVPEPAQISDAVGDRLAQIEQALKTVEPFSEADVTKSLVVGADPLDAEQKRTAGNSSLSTTSLSTTNPPKATQVLPGGVDKTFGSAVEAQPKPKPKSSSEQPQTNSTASVKPDLNSAQAVTSAEESKKNKAPTSKYYRDRSWLLAQADSHYSAQVLGSYSEQTARRFAEKLAKAGDPVVYVLTTRKKREWYIVLYDIYDSKAAAQKGVANARQVVRKQTPWIRGFSAIKGSL